MGIVFALWCGHTVFCPLTHRHEGRDRVAGLTTKIRLARSPSDAYRFVTREQAPTGFEEKRREYRLLGSFRLWRFLPRFAVCEFTHHRTRLSCIKAHVSEESRDLCGRTLDRYSLVFCRGRRSTGSTRRATAKWYRLVWLIGLRHRPTAFDDNRDAISAIRKLHAAHVAKPKLHTMQTMTKRRVERVLDSRIGRPPTERERTCTNM